MGETVLLVLSSVLYVCVLGVNILTGAFCSIITSVFAAILLAGYWLSKGDVAFILGMFLLSGVLSIPLFVRIFQANHIRVNSFDIYHTSGKLIEEEAVPGCYWLKRNIFMYTIENGKPYIVKSQVMRRSKGFRHDGSYELRVVHSSSEYAELTDWAVPIRFIPDNSKRKNELPPA